MIGIVIVSHGNLAVEFQKVAEHIMGPQKNVKTVCVNADDDVEARRKDVLKAINSVEAGEGVVVLTDMFGGTPSNLALSLLGKACIEIIAGFNLPLMVKLLTVRESKPLHAAVLDAQEAGQKYIHVATHLLTKPTEEVQSANE